MIFPPAARLETHGPVRGRAPRADRYNKTYGSAIRPCHVSTGEKRAPQIVETLTQF